MEIKVQSLQSLMQEEMEKMPDTKRQLDIMTELFNREQIYSIKVERKLLGAEQKFKKSQQSSQELLGVVETLCCSRSNSETHGFSEPKTKSANLSSSPWGSVKPRPAENLPSSPWGPVKPRPAENLPSSPWGSVKPRTAENLSSSLWGPVKQRPAENLPSSPWGPVRPGPADNLPSSPWGPGRPRPVQAALLVARLLYQHPGYNPNL